MNPVVTAFGLLPVAFVSALYSVHYALAIILGWLTLFAFYLERRILEFCLFPPFAGLVLWQFLGLGVGVSLIVSEAPFTFDPALLQMQLIWILGFPLFYLSYGIAFDRIQLVPPPIAVNSQQKRILKPLYYIGWILLISRMVGYLVGAYTGAEDRGELGLANVSDANFGLWTIFQLVPRFNYIGFLLVPLLITGSGLVGRLVLFSLLSCYFVLAFVSGGRGNVFYPLIFILAGYYAFHRLPRLSLDVIVVIMAIAFLPLIFFMGSYRGTEGFVSSQMIDVRARLAAVGQTGEQMRLEADVSGSGGRTVTGTALLGVNDRLIYQLTPDVIPFAGADGFAAVPWVWVPTFFLREKPNLIDGNYIVAQYVDYQIGRGTGATISLPADLYRRFGWFGVIFGMPLAMFLYGALASFCYSVYLTRNVVVGTVLVLYTISFVTWSPLQTVLTTWWGLAYDFPRHLAVLFFIYLLSVSHTRVGVVHGAQHYWRLLGR